MNANTEARLSAMMANAQDAVQKGTHWYSASGLVEQAKTQGLSAMPTPSEWVRQRRLFALELDGEQRVPEYGLNPQTWQPLPAMAAIIKILESRDALFLAVWFESVNSYLGGICPREVLAQDPVRVILAAQAEAEGVTQG